MADGWVHTEYRAGRWINQIEGAEIIGSYPTQAQASEVGRTHAKLHSTQHLIHRIDGSVVERHDYNPPPPHP